MNEAEKEVTESPEKEEPIATVSTDSASDAALLRAERDALRRELSDLRTEMEEQQRKRADREDFRSLYPEVSMDTLPKEVQDASIPLAAAYALYCRKQERQQQLAAEENQRTRQLTSGALHHDGGGDGEFTVEEIRRMSPAAVRQHYTDILRSLKKTK